MNLLIANLQPNLQNPDSGFWCRGSGSLVSASRLIGLAYLQIPDSGFGLPVSGFRLRYPGTLDLLIANLQDPDSGFWFPGSGFLVSASKLTGLAYLQIPDSGFWLAVSGYRFRFPDWACLLIANLPIPDSGFWFPFSGFRFSFWAGTEK